MRHAMRHCLIVDAAIEEKNGAGDGAYSLFGVSGTPEEIGKAIADALAEGDMSRGRTAIIGEEDGELYLDIRIKFASHTVAADE